MLEGIGSKDNVSKFLEEVTHCKRTLFFLLVLVSPPAIQVKARKKKLMGFGHRIYKNYDPRASIIKKTAYEVHIRSAHSSRN